ncbi:hypothetical protein V6Z11_D02G197800 [Gossypium hirsutum]
MDCATISIDTDATIIHYLSLCYHTSSNTTTTTAENSPNLCRANWYLFLSKEEQYTENQQGFKQSNLIQKPKHELQQISRNANKQNSTLPLEISFKQRVKIHYL